jgi:DNA-directed RNA polymerase subunit beta'
LKGLKENIIVGRLIPVGTGSIVNRLKNIAAERDKETLAAKAPKPVPIIHVQEEVVVTSPPEEPVAQL